MQRFCARRENKSLLLSELSVTLHLYPYFRSVMNIFMISALLALAPIGLAVIFLYRTLASRQDSNVSADQLLAVSPEKYRPMERLLQEEDFRFLSSQPGFSPQLGRRFRMLVVHAADDRGDLAKSLMRLRVTFGLGMVAVEGRLLLHAAGLGTVDVRGLVESLAAMQAQIQMLLTPPQTATASL
jgi:hypothetical protein